MDGIGHVLMVVIDASTNIACLQDIV